MAAARATALGAGARQVAKVPTTRHARAGRGGEAMRYLDGLWRRRSMAFWDLRLGGKVAPRMAVPRMRSREMAAGLPGWLAVPKDGCSSQHPQDSRSQHGRQHGSQDGRPSAPACESDARLSERAGHAQETRRRHASLVHQPACGWLALVWPLVSPSLPVPLALRLSPSSGPGPGGGSERGIGYPSQANRGGMGVEKGGEGPSDVGLRVRRPVRPSRGSRRVVGRRSLLVARRRCSSTSGQCAHHRCIDGHAQVDER
ncbi:hypothetical protein CDD83_7566 [Cordyceps sp. RAO-2017]|nr:hypothetical protein CDD83_7566 [Cordyceps sp. RAO-2017]